GRRGAARGGRGGRGEGRSGRAPGAPPPCRRNSPCRGRPSAGTRPAPPARSPGALRASAADARTTPELRELGELHPPWTPRHILSSPGRERERAARSGASQARSASVAPPETAHLTGSSFANISLARIRWDIALDRPA